MTAAEIMAYAQAAKAAAPIAQIGLNLTQGLIGAVTGRPVPVANYQQYVQPQTVAPPPPAKSDNTKLLLIGGAALLAVLLLSRK